MLDSGLLFYHLFSVYPLCFIFLFFLFFLFCLFKNFLSFILIYLMGFYLYQFAFVQWLLCGLLVKREVSKILPCWKANKLACCNIMDAVRRHETPWSEIRDSLLLIVIVVANVSVIRVMVSWDSFLKEQHGENHLTSANTVNGIVEKKLTSGSWLFVLGTNNRM